MGVVRPAGWCVVRRNSETVLAIMKTKKAAQRRMRVLRERGELVYVAEMYFSDGLLEDE